MVFYFTTEHNGISWSIFMGRDKFENEDLIKYGIDLDVWFHVDNLSSAHVYIRMPEGFTFDTIPEPVVQDCSQLVKANSIEGCKKSSVKIIYTPWSNLLKKGDMAVGQVGFYNQKLVKYCVVTKKNEVINRINKTKKEKPSSFIKESKTEYEREKRMKDRKLKNVSMEQSKKEKIRAQVEREMLENPFADLFENAKSTSNQNMDVTAEEYEHDFI